MSDYQIFDLVNGQVENIGPRMLKKLHALKNSIPEDLTEKSVIDIGCDHGFWSFLCAQRGAESVLGLDRGRKVSGEYVDLPALNNSRSKGTVCHFKKTNLGTEWRYFGRHDISLLMSLYHHIYHQCEDHDPIWYWLYRHTRETLIWENPTDQTDSVVQMNVSSHLWPKYTEKHILESASKYFNYKYVGPAEHEPTRSVFLFTPKKLQTPMYAGKMIDGAGGATPAFLYEDGRRIKEFERIVGMSPYPGSLNVQLETPFDWESHYFRSKILDVSDRSQGLEGSWIKRWARLYPVIVNGKRAFIFKFESDSYPPNFIELIADSRLRDCISSSENFVMVQSIV